MTLRHTGHKADYIGNEQLKKNNKKKFCNFMENNIQQDTNCKRIMTRCFKSAKIIKMTKNI